jgi:hypothetical protein
MIFAMIGTSALKRSMKKPVGLAKPTSQRVVLDPICTVYQLIAHSGNFIEIMRPASREVSGDATLLFRKLQNYRYLSQIGFHKSQIELTGNVTFRL